MKKHFIRHWLILLATIPAACALAQINGTSDIDQRGSAGPVYGQSPQSSKMTPGGSQGQEERAATRERDRRRAATGADNSSGSSSGNSSGNAASGPNSGNSRNSANRDRERSRSSHDDDRARSASERK